MVAITSNVGSFDPGLQSFAGGIKPSKSPVSDVSDNSSPVSSSVKQADPVAAMVAVDQINKVLQHFNSDLEFSVDPETKIDVVKVVDKSTKEIIRQMPSQDMIDISKALGKLQGILIRGKA